MKKLNLKKQWQIIKDELFFKKPQIENSYPEEIVRKREILLIAQVLLNSYENTKSKKQKEKIKKIYKKGIKNL